MALIDLFAILPFYLPMVIVIDLRFLRILRLARILRIFKIQRYNNSLSLISSVIDNRKEELIVTLFITFLLLLLASSIMYFVETNSQPESFPNIIASFWWAIATLTTVGYGDVYPVTVIGKILSGIIALLGIGIVALPTGIISSGFIEEMNKGKKNCNNTENRDTSEKEKKYCPYCGKKL
jgi:voltage-gated potassium channel